MITLTSLLIYIGIAATILTLIVVYGFKNHKSVLMSFVQNFCGSLFVFSGLVKAVDPLGTAYKMEDYFNEFYYTFQDSALSFMAPMFTFLHDYSLALSVFMIVFEIILGLMLIIGSKPKWTAWAFFLLVLFFTVLTGFTYLTGYVSDGVNFFSFSEWGPYVKSNMKVTDCGCFGDFIKLEPFTSFLKDIALLVPSIYFLVRSKKMHQMLSTSSRTIVLGVATIGLLIYCFSNFLWDIPGVDFRPFKNNADIAQIRDAEMQSSANVQVLGYKLKNNKTGKTEEIPSEQYLTMIKNGEYTKDEGWEVVDQVLTEPELKETKISEFFIEDFEGNDLNDKYLNNPTYRMMVVSYKMYSDDQIVETSTVVDTIYRMDTILVDGQKDPVIARAVDGLSEREVKTVNYIWDADFRNDYEKIVSPMADAAKADGIEMAVVLGGATLDMAIDFATELEMPVDYETADGILLKTIVRSNPGFVLWKDGKIIQKWHKDQVPSYDIIKSEYMK